MSEENGSKAEVLRVRSENVTSKISHDHDTGVIVLQQMRTQDRLNEEGVTVDEQVREAFILHSSDALNLCRLIMDAAIHMNGPEAYGMVYNEETNEFEVDEESDL